MGANDPTRLEYEDRVVVAMRKQYRLLLILTLLNTILLAGFIVVPTFVPYAKTQWQQYQESRERKRIAQQRQALYERLSAYQAPPELVVYEERPADAAKLLVDSRYAAMRSDVPYFPTRPWQPPVYFKDPSLGSDAQNLADGNIVVFAHLRKAATGEERLIAVTLASSQNSSGPNTLTPTVRAYPVHTTRILAVSVISPTDRRRALSFQIGRDEVHSLATVTRSTDWEHGTVELAPQGLFRIYAGQANPADPSRFTIRYQVDGRDGVIDGRLIDATHVELQPHEGAIVDRRGNALVWIPSTAPITTQPSAGTR